MHRRSPARNRHGELTLRAQYRASLANFETQDRYRELLRATREFIYLRAMKRARADPEGTINAGDLAVLCPACPHLRYNMDPRWRERAEGDR